jgi:pimeloyl-ACP methyl ester carboxylesterase
VSEPQFSPDQVRFVTCRDGAGTRRLAARRREGAGPTVVWLGGFRSDMLATKASRLDRWACERGRAFLRFDYAGHGESEGRFEDQTIGGWVADALAVIDALAEGERLVLVGSSMGGWIALLVAKAMAARGEAGRLAALVLIAPAVDFTEALIWDELPEAAREQMLTTGVWRTPSAYSEEPDAITLRLIEEGRAHLLFGAPLRAHAPVHILQGLQDPDVPWRHAQKLFERLTADPAVVTYVRDGDHRLSREEDLRLLVATVEAAA